MGIVSQFSSKQANYSTLTTFVKIFFVISSSPDASSLKNELEFITMVQGYLSDLSIGNTSN